MKKVFLALIVLTLVSCEREVENVDKNETFEKSLKQQHETNSSKSASDSLQIRNISSDAGLEPTPDPTTDPNEDVDPKDIKTPPRK